MSTMAISFRQPVLPWAASADDDRRFQRILRGALLAALGFGLALPFIPIVERVVTRDVPVPVAKMLLENAPVVKAKIEPPRPLPAEKRVAQRDTAVPETAKPEPDKPAVEPERPKPAPGKMKSRDPVPDQPAVTMARNPVEGKAPGEDLAAARRKATGVGLLAMKDQLADLRGAPVAVQINAPVKPGPGVGTGTGPGVGAGTEAGLPTRNLITAGVAAGSGGVNVAALSRDTGGGGLAGRATTMVEGVAGGGGGGGAGGGGGGRGGNGMTGNGVGNGTGTGTGAGGGGSVQRAGSGKASRSIEEIRLVFERNKGSIYAIYNRALRDEPGLQGKVVVELKIAPDGHVIDCRLVSSELKTPELEGKLLARIRSFAFAAKDVETMIVSWPVDFLPS